MIVDVLGRISNKYRQMHSYITKLPLY